ncbi:MAG: glycosyltransferase family 2 protein [Epsilonproteobacteria bacterium]|nr:MAG: glycosyltransferase family 2 protein [Campylobacterota bacterium]RLA67815.1 MAG: glycosyltransferase family 2 protein [Campylobacterota bacterium]
MISIIIPTYNRSAYLFRAIESVQYQTYKDWELIIVDDGSTDNTQKEITYLLKEEKKIKYIKTPNRGVSAARNLGIHLSSGDYLAFLDSDDEWLPEKLELQMEFVNTNPEIELVHGDEIWIRNGKRVNQKNIHKKFGGNIFSQSLDLCAISPSTAFLKRSLFKRVGFFREDFPVCEDYDLWLRVTSRNEVGFIARPLIVKYGGHEGQLSNKYFGMDYWRLKSMLSLIKSVHLKPTYRNLLQKKINEKTIILVAGAKKHKNVDLLNKLETLC